jgi:hypothetical protein
VSEETEKTGIDMDLTELPRTTLDAGMAVLRLPLTATEMLLRPGRDNSQWPPAVVFDRIDATVRETVGRVLRDDALIEQARLERSEASMREQAMRKEAEADERAQEARERIDSAQERAEEKRQRVEEQREQRRSAVEQRRRESEQEARQRAQTKKATVRKANDRQRRAVASKAQQAKVARLDAEAGALATKKRAAKANAEVLDLDQKVKQTKARRRSS